MEPGSPGIRSRLQRNTLLVVLGNFGFLSAAESLCRLIAVVTVGFYARQLQPEMFGYLSLAVAAVSYFGIIAVFGTDLLGTREVACDRANARQYAANVLGIRLYLSAGVYAALAVVVWLAAPLRPLRTLLLVEGLALFPLACNPSWVYQGLQEMRVPAMVRVMQAALACVLVLMLVRGARGAVWVSFSSVLAAAGACIVLLVMLWRSIGVFRPALQLNFAILWLRRAAVFALLGAAGQVYAQSGLLLLGWWHTATDVGLFSSSYRLTYGLVQSFASLLMLSFLPALSAAVHSDPASMRRLHRSYALLSNVCAAGVVVVFGVFPELVLRLCFGSSYVPAAPLLRVLACCVAASFVSGPYVAALMAAGCERILLCQTTGFAALCVLLNVLWIPAHGGNGAAWALLVSISAGTLSSVFFYHRMVAGREPALPEPVPHLT